MKKLRISGRFKIYIDSDRDLTDKEFDNLRDWLEFHLCSNLPSNFIIKFPRIHSAFIQDMAQQTLSTHKVHIRTSYCVGYRVRNLQSLD